MLPKEIKLRRNGSMETVLDIVIPYIHDGDDRNSISLVSRRFYELDCITRKHLTVHAHYATNPSRVSQRFPFIDSLTLKGVPDWDFPQFFDFDISPWIKEISVKFEYLKALHIRGVCFHDEDLELLAKTRGKDLRSLKICKCAFSTDGFMHVSNYCNDLWTLCLELNDNRDAHGKDGRWLHELALHNKVIESLHFDFNITDVDDLTLIAKTCSNSLVSLKLSPNKPLNHIRDVFSHAIKLEDFDGTATDEDRDHSIFEFPPSIRGLGIKDMPVTSFPFLLPYVNQLQKLDLTCMGVEYYCCQCFLIERCPNLEVLCTVDVCGDMGLRVIVQVCKKLRKLTHYGRVTHMGLIALVQGCTNLEYLNVSLSDISSEAIECVGTHLKNLRDFRIYLCEKPGITGLPLDNGIRALLIGCSKLRRLHISLGDGEMTNVGLGYIGKYGHNLRCLFLNCVAASDAGLVELSKGCPKLRKLCLENCPFSQEAVTTFVFNIHSLRYIRIKSGDKTVLALTRPTSAAEVLTELTQYVTLTEKLRKLAVQLVADGSGPGSVKITYTSLRAKNDLDTSLVDAMVAKGICINKERIVLDRASEKPLEVIKVQITNVESRVAFAISESGEIIVEGRVKDGVPYLTKVGVLDVFVSLEGNIILYRQYGKPEINKSLSRILHSDLVNICSMTLGGIAQTNQAFMVMGVHRKISEKALKKIDKIRDVKEFIFVAL